MSYDKRLPFFQSFYVDLWLKGSFIFSQTLLSSFKVIKGYFAGTVKGVT